MNQPPQGPPSQPPQGPPAPPQGGAPPQGPPPQYAPHQYRQPDHLPPNMPPPYGYGAPGMRPHRGGAILALGICGFISCAITGIIAWALGSSDLKAMQAGHMDATGRGSTNAGKICGIVSCCLYGTYFVLYLFTMSALGCGAYSSM